MRRCACRLSHAHPKSERCGRMAERCGVWQVVKNEGNELFKESHFADALEKYNQAIDLNPEVPTYYCNRAFCHTKMENHGLAIEDAGVALTLTLTLTLTQAQTLTQTLTLTLSLTVTLTLSLSLTLILTLTQKWRSSPNPNPNPGPGPSPRPSPNPNPSAGVALELDRSCAKGYYRRAASYMALGKYKKARC